MASGTKSSSTSSSSGATRPVGSYSWTQTDEEVTIVLSFPAVFSVKDVAVKLLPHSIVAGIKGHPPTISGAYPSNVEPDGSWTFEKISATESAVEIHLQKVDPEVWPAAIVRDGPNAEMDGQSLYLAAGLTEASDIYATLSLLTKAAAKGNIPAQLKLGAWFQLGRENNCPVDRDVAESAWYYMQAAEAGSGEAQFMLARAYERGEGVGRSYEQALALYTQAANHEHSCTESSAFHLGVLLHTGDDTHSPNIPEASKWWELAASMDSAAAHYNLGVLHYYGKGVPQDLVRAREHFTAAQALDPKLTNIPELDSLDNEEDDEDGVDELDPMRRSIDFEAIARAAQTMKAGPPAMVITPTRMAGSPAASAGTSTPTGAGARRKAASGSAPHATVSRLTGASASSSSPGTPRAGTPRRPGTPAPGMIADGTATPASDTSAASPSWFIDVAAGVSVLAAAAAAVFVMRRS
ncbi:hypothetical protein CAOG_05541 [Capsaspora owczarzaki ATCC 30864]|uniref:CS domain-containing protein n=1 Tax=Capsaspora owczarzaki (strain ATCC 30864) TaxID=595528 RepID=A0A0D2UIP3_CAPO3|nr:hypothetical protein CAOG_05541 [Capsaspora owczarzaki ATCC 30864]KJE95011.1 hypothetical protein CAOG_005541 [Capsaspora owczarzaki ATCC 30864]|eukprot:XP_004346214.1 hypothetical protein CAOG_05541 [Capsaspora owczarzaki ATCC 30864]